MCVRSFRLTENVDPLTVCDDFVLVHVGYFHGLGARKLETWISEVRDFDRLMHALQTQSHVLLSCRTIVCCVAEKH